MTDQPSEAQLRERAKWSAASDAIADTMASTAFNSNNECNAIQFGKPPAAEELNAYQMIPPAYIAAHQIAVGAAPIEARVKALETALAVLNDRVAVMEADKANAYKALLSWPQFPLSVGSLVAVETAEKQPDAEPHVVIAHKVPDKPAEPEAPIHAAIRASSEPKPMVGPMGNPQPK